MAMRLKEMSPGEYARAVLPLTAPLWAGSRDFETYVRQTLELARSAYGRRYYRTIGLFDGNALVASFKRYERTLHHQGRPLRGIGFGAVFTPEEFRGRGYASVMIAAELDRSRSEGFELAYLFSDIRPQFYATFGFRELPSRDLTLNADALSAQRIRPTQLQDEDWKGVRRCFDACEQKCAAGFTRSTAVWKWIEARVRQCSEHLTGRAHNLVVRNRRGVQAYVLGDHVPERDAYIFDEFGFADDASGTLLIPALLRAAAGDLRRVTGWAPPAEARALLPKGTTHKRKRSVLMMAPLRAGGSALLDKLGSKASSAFCWPTDHI
jgi:predicted N-acetyltransferase YhbS